VPDLFHAAPNPCGKKIIPNYFAPPLAQWPDEAKTWIEKLQDECEVRDQGHSECLEDLEYCRDALARVLRDGVPEWSRPLLHEVLRRIDSNI
jgi:hypothetical protein